MDRTLLPLALMYAGDKEPIEGRTRLQKMVFLMQKHFEEKGEDTLQSQDYEFVPYDYGPFSKELYADLDTLIENEMVNDNEEPLPDDKMKYIYEVENPGEEFISEQLSKEEAKKILDLAEEIKKEYNNVLLSDLIEEVYSRYPEYAQNSIY